jgi:RNA polymerase sigma-70 factor (ECF subfamily)
MLASPPDHSHEPQHGLAAAVDAELIDKLRQGDEDAFMKLVEEYQLSMFRVVSMYVQDQAVAEEVIQDTWIGVLKGLDRFEGRSSLKTWIFTILTNRAKTQAQREGRYISASDLIDDDEPDEPSVDPSRFLPEGHRYAGHWATKPGDWSNIPEEYFLSLEIRSLINIAINRLPTSQRKVITLRDIEGWSSDQVCNILEISDTNQRVLLHRARSSVRRAIESYVNDKELDQAK